MAMGQGAGTAAALGVARGYGIPDMDFGALRTTLAEQGAVIDFDNVAARAADELSDLPVGRA